MSSSQETTAYFGVSQPISVAFPEIHDLELNEKLVKTLKQFNCYETVQGTVKRVEVLTELNFILKKWVANVTKERLPHIQHSTGGKLFSFGSYRLGVHSPGADIDTLAVVPRHVTRKDFFSSFKALLAKNPKVSELQAVEKAFVPLLKLKFDGIELDVLFARLALSTVPDNQDLFDDSLLRNLDAESIRSLNGCRVAEQLLRSVPSKIEFCLALRAVKLWAKNQGLYSNSMGFFGGITWAILVARTCQLYPNACAARIVQKVFFVFATWNWPNPVMLKKMDDSPNELAWNPKANYADRLHLMPILTPAYPEQNSTHNVTQSTASVIQTAIKEALDTANQVWAGKASWNDFFQEVNFFSRYRHFIALTLEAESEEEKRTYSGFFESRIRQLVGTLERNSGIRIAHVNPCKFNSKKEGQLVWFIGLEFAEHAKQMDLTREIHNFNNILEKQASRGVGINCNVKTDIFYVKRANLIQLISAAELRRGKFYKKSPESSPNSSDVPRKRKLSEESAGRTEKKKMRVIDVNCQ